MSSPPSKGRDDKGAAPGLPMENSQGETVDRGIGEVRLTRGSHSIPTSEPKGRKQRARRTNNTRQALNDAQQGLHSLLNPPNDDKQPVIISPTGANRQVTRGRIAGPSPDAEAGPQATADNYLLLEGGDTGTGLVPVTKRPSSIAHSESSSPTDRAIQSLVSARSRAMMLVHPLDGDTGLLLDDHAAHSSRRAAAQWVTRYATHAIVLLVVGLLVAFGGLRTLTVAKAGEHNILSANAFTGTDSIHDDDEEANNGKPGIDSQDFQLTLPRTELSGAVVPPAPVADNLNNPGSPGQQAAIEQAARAAEVNRYTVAEGDTIESVAERFNVMPETVMGSNGIFDPNEELAAGRLLVVPPVDGMYYVAVQGDTLPSIAHRFQVAPEVITSYTGNKLGPNGELSEGTPLVVPGGMMPERETIITYTVKKGDILKKIASRFGIDVPTMLNSNDIPDPDNLQPGTTLRVLPVQGLEYKVRKGDSIIAIANRYGTTPQMILDYEPNHLSADGGLQIDQVIMLPGGSPPEEVMAAVRVAPREQPSSRGVERPPVQPKTQPQPQPQPKTQPQPQPKAQPQPAVKQQPKTDNSVKVGTGRMVWPVNGTITQYFTRSHNGLDIAISAGTPIHAADSGRVVWSGWRTDGLGYCVMIDHLNGYTTVYGHMIRQPKVYVGQYLARGQVIGYIGSTGRSTGPHVHFMVKRGSAASHDYRNPLAYLSR